MCTIGRWPRRLRRIACMHCIGRRSGNKMDSMYNITPTSTSMEDLDNGPRLGSDVDSKYWRKYLFSTFTLPITQYRFHSTTPLLPTRMYFPLSSFPLDLLVPLIFNCLATSSSPSPTISSRILLATILAQANGGVHCTVRSIRICKNITKAILSPGVTTLAHSSITRVPALRKERAIHSLRDTKRILQHVTHNMVTNSRVSRCWGMSEVICCLRGAG